MHKSKILNQAKKKRIQMKVTSCVLVFKSAKKLIQKKSGSAFHYVVEKWEKESRP